MSKIILVKDTENPAIPVDTKGTVNISIHLYIADLGGAVMVFYQRCFEMCPYHALYW